MAARRGKSQARRNGSNGLPGWAWLVIGGDGKLKVTKTPNGANPLSTGEGQPILGCDVWEHSYYIDYRNARPKYLEAWFDNLINWDHVEEMAG